MSLNGWGGKLHDKLIPYLQAMQPDVLCLQEVIHTPASPKDWLTYRDGDHVLQQRAGLFDEVRAVLPDHFAVFCPAARGDLWDDTERHISEWGLATFVHRSFPVIGQTQRFVHKQFSPHGYGDHPRSRSAHAVRLYNPGRDWTITIAHMHGLRDTADKQDNPARKAQAERLRDLTLATAGEGDRIVVCGDFNVLPASETFDILAQIGLRDLVTARGFTGTRTSHYAKSEKHANYCLVNAPLMQAGFDVVSDPEVSDHCPLIVDTDITHD